MQVKSFICLLAVAMTAVSAAATPVGDAVLLDIRGSTNLKNGKTCSQSVQCKSQFCNRAKCDDKKTVGQSCYKNVGCQSGLCGTNGKCAAAPGTQALGTKCEKSTQCASGYCGRARCASKSASGQACYKDAGCTSGFCVNAKCSATNGTAPSTDGGSGKGNLGDFSSGTLGAWTAAPANKVSVVADADSPGGYVVRATSSDGVSTLISRDNIPATVQRRQNVDNPTFYLAAQFEFRVTNYTRLATVDVDPVTLVCSASIIVNGKATGLQSIGGGPNPEDTPPLNKWYSMSNGNLGYTDQLTSVSIGPYCRQNAIMTMDIRNITKYVDDLRNRGQQQSSD